MIRKIVDSQKLNEVILNLLVEKFPDGYSDKDIIAFRNAQNEYIEDVEVTETDTNGCSTTSTLEVTISNEPTNIYEYNTTRKLIKTINLLGQEIKPQKNQSYIEIYDDGTRKRKIIIE